MATCAECGAAVPDGARFCPSCGAASEPAAAPQERKLATVLFADLVGSTALGESQDPERTRAMLDRFYDAMAAEIERAGGTVEKFVGDAVMAVFGAPAAQEDHAERALHVALAMRRRLGELFGDGVQMRIGVNTGEVVVGRAREGGSFVTGDAVNVCARLEQNVAPGEILVGERTAAIAHGAFEFGEPTRIDARGKPDGVACRRLIRALTLMRPRGVGGLRRAFVGRESELDLLAATYRRVVHDGGTHLVTIMGDAGVGKTRLARELWDWLGAQPEEPLRRTGRCLPYGHGITYWALGEILKEHLGILEGDPPELVRQRLRGREALGLALGLALSEDVHPLAARDRLHEAWVDFLDDLASDRPAVVLVEDLHWAEEPLLDLLERVLGDVRAPVFVLATARPELLDSRPTWGGGRRNSSLLWLEPLSTAESGRMLDGLLAEHLPAALRDLVVERAEGNPFFVEELIGTLIDSGVIERRDGQWTASGPPEDFVVPDSVQAVLAARIDLLPPLEKAALQAASVIGRVFWTGPLRELLEGVEPDVALLEDRDFVRRRSGSSMAGHREYVIKHALTREVAYASLPKAKRAQLHAAFAEWLEREVRGKDDVASVLAHHYAEAMRPEDADLAWAGEAEAVDRLKPKAIAWLRRAGALALGRYELDDALALLHRALELELEPPERAAIWREIGRVNALRFDGEAFWTAMQESLAIDTDQAVAGDTYSLLAFQTSIRSGMWKRRPEPEVVDPWIERALELSDPETPARARALIARAYWRPGEEEQTAREATSLAERLDDPELRSYAWMARAAVEFHALRFSEAAEWALRRFDVAPEITNPDHLAEIRETALPAIEALGRLQEARRLAREHIELSKRLSPHHRLHGADLLVEAEELAGGWDEIRSLEPFVRQAVSDNADTPCVRNARVLLVCALACAHAGDDEGARELESAVEELGMEGHSVALDAPRIGIALVRGDLDTVRGLVQPELELWYAFALPNIAVRLDALAALGDGPRAEREAPLYLKRGTYFEPIALRTLGVVRNDHQLIRQALSRFDAMGLAWHAEETRELLS